VLSPTPADQASLSASTQVPTPSAMPEVQAEVSPPACDQRRVLRETASSPLGQHPVSSLTYPCFWMQSQFTLEGKAAPGSQLFQSLLLN
jgi:hypothetical protein